jgi:integrase
VPEFGPPKSKAGFRTVPLPDVVSTVLAEHVARYRRASSDLIFTSSYGRPLRRNTAGEMWHRAARKAELSEWATFHDLRHFYASLRHRSDTVFSLFDADVVDSGVVS